VVEHRWRGLRVLPHSAHLEPERGACADHQRRISKEYAEAVADFQGLDQVLAQVEVDLRVVEIDQRH
jgi:hypothetical protein